MTKDDVIRLSIEFDWGFRRRNITLMKACQYLRVCTMPRNIQEMKELERRLDRFYKIQTGVNNWYKQWQKKLNTHPEISVMQTLADLRWRFEVFSRS